MTLKSDGQTSAKSVDNFSLISSTPVPFFDMSASVHCLRPERRRCHRSWLIAGHFRRFRRPYIGRSWPMTAGYHGRKETRPRFCPPRMTMPTHAAHNEIIEISRWPLVAIYNSSECVERVRCILYALLQRSFIFIASHVPQIDNLLFASKW